MTIKKHRVETALFVRDKMESVWVEIDLDNLVHNIREVKRLVGEKAIIMAVVKSNAYGHGVLMCARTFLAHGAERLAVARLNEGIQIRNLGIKAPVLVLGATSSQEASNALNYDLTLTVFTHEFAKKLSEVAQTLGKKANVHIELDTGLARQGIQLGSRSIEEIAKIAKLPLLNVEGIFTQFAMADTCREYTKKQFKRFMLVVKKIREMGMEIPLKHVSDSAAIINNPEYTLDMVRPGAILYGLNPSRKLRQSRRVPNSRDVHLKPAMTLKARISSIRIVPSGTGIGYSHTFVTNRRSVIGTLPVGYADGYRVALSNQATVGIGKGRSRIVGRICMDQCMVDLTNVSTPSVGDDVVLFGGSSNNAPHIDEVAEWLSTENCEITSTVGRRVPRVYFRKGKIVRAVDYLID